MDKANVGSVAIKGAQVGQSINSFIDGFNVVNLAEAGEIEEASQVAGEGFSSASEASQWGRAAQGSAVAAVANIVVHNIGLDKETAQDASLAINTVYLIYVCAFPNPVTIALAAVAEVLSLAGVAGFFSESRTLPRVYWHGKVNISFNKHYPYKFGVNVKTTAHKTVGDISDKVEQEFNKNIQKINKGLKKLPNKDVDFVLKYVARPVNSMNINVDAGRATDGVEDRFSKQLGQQMQEIIKKIQKVAVELSYLHFLASVRAKDNIKQRAIDKIPQIKYKVEGAWRTEEERLAIKLMQRREYARQIKLMMTALIYQSLPNKRRFLPHQHPQVKKIVNSSTTKHNVNEGKGYIKGNVPSINVPEILNVDLGGLMNGPSSTFLLKFKIKPQKTKNRVQFKGYDIHGNIKQASTTLDMGWDFDFGFGF